ncbi:hypothetical protein WR25_26010 [Diploscapter pachys]|uniref:Uncharacterized protein n=2 Tax=cellular organisms TaxID=131567 RepID=A0A2A2K4L9_9BILA|nr:hypothetical protein WR25_26010 [Diploscapter pachys]
MVGQPRTITRSERIEGGGKRIVGRAGPGVGSVDDEAADAFERGGLVAGVTVELAHQFLRMVGDERDRVAHAGDEDVEEALVGEVGLVGEHDPDSAIGGDALRHVHVERVGERQAREHRVAGLERDRVFRGEFDGDAAVLDCRDSRERGIVHAAVLVVVGPADRLALVQVHGIEGGYLEAFKGDRRVELLGHEADTLAAATHLDLARKDPRNLEGAAPSQPDLRDMPGDGDLLADLVGLRVAQFLRRHADAVVDGDVEAGAFERPLGEEAVLDAGVDFAACLAARGEYGGDGALVGGKRQPEVGCVRGGAGGVVGVGPGAWAHLDDIVAEHAERGARLAHIGEFGDGLERIGALAQIVVHVGDRRAGRLDDRERLAGIDRHELLLVADAADRFDPERIGDAEEFEEVVVRNHRHLVDDDDGVLHLVAPGLRGGRVGGGDVAFALPDERGDRLCLDPRPGLHVGDHLVLEGKAVEATALAFEGAGGRLEDGRLASAGDALDEGDTVGARDDEGGGGELAGVEVVRRGRLEERRRGIGGDDGGDGIAALVDCGEDAFLGGERFRGGDHAVAGVMLADLAGDEAAGRGEPLDAALDMLDGNALHAEVERLLGEAVDVEGGFAGSEDAHRRGDGELRAGIGGGAGDAGDAPVDQRIGGGEVMAEDLAGGGDGAADRVGAALERAAACVMVLRAREALGRREQVLAVEAEGCRLVDPVLAQGVAIVVAEFGIAGARGHLAQPLRAPDPELLGSRENVGAALAEGVDDLLRYAGDLEGAVLAAGFDLEADLLHAGAQVCVIDRADDGVVGPDAVGVERLPLAVGHAGHVGDDRVDVRLRVEGAARVVLEEGVDEVAGLDGHLLAADVLAGLGEVLLDPRHGLADRLHLHAVRPEDPLVAGDIGHQRHRFGGREGEVEAGAAVLDLADLFARRQLTVQRALEGRLVDRTRQAGVGRALAAPLANLTVLGRAPDAERTDAIECMGSVHAQPIIAIDIGVMMVMVMVAGAEVLADLDDGIARSLGRVGTNIPGCALTGIAQVLEHDDLATGLPLCLTLRTLGVWGGIGVARIEPLGGFALRLLAGLDLAFGRSGEDAVRQRRVGVAWFGFRLTRLRVAVPPVLLRRFAHAPLLSASGLIVRRSRTALHEAVGDTRVMLPFETDARGGKAFGELDVPVHGGKVGDVVGDDQRLDLGARGQRRGIAGRIIAVAIAFIHLADLAVADVARALLGGVEVGGSEDQFGARQRGQVAGIFLAVNLHQLVEGVDTEDDRAAIVARGLQALFDRGQAVERADLVEHEPGAQRARVRHGHERMDGKVGPERQQRPVHLEVGVRAGDEEDRTGLLFGRDPLLDREALLVFGQQQERLGVGVVDGADRLGHAGGFGRGERVGDGLFEVTVDVLEVGGHQVLGERPVGRLTVLDELQAHLDEQACVERVEDGIAVGIVERLCIGAGEVEDDGAVLALTHLFEECPKRGGLARSGRADEHRVRLFEPVRIGDAGDRIGVVDAGGFALGERLLQDDTRIDVGEEGRGILAEAVEVESGYLLVEHVAGYEHRAALMAVLHHRLAATRGEGEVPDRQRDRDERGEQRRADEAAYRLGPGTRHFGNVGDISHDGRMHRIIGHPQPDREDDGVGYEEGADPDQERHLRALHPHADGGVEKLRTAGEVARVAGAFAARRGMRQMDRTAIAADAQRAYGVHYCSPISSVLYRCWLVLRVAPGRVPVSPRIGSDVRRKWVLDGVLRTPGFMASADIISPISLTKRTMEMAKSLDAELAAIEAEERKLSERRKAHQGRLREAAIQSVEKAGLLKLPLDRLDGLMRVVKTLGVEEVEKRLKASA